MKLNVYLYVIEIEFVVFNYWCKSENNTIG